MKSFSPYIPATKTVREFTLRAIILGCLLGVLFGIGNTYLGLKVGTTVSASVPAAVLSMAILRSFFRNVTILENNLVQTIASVGEGLAAGVIFTAPALFILGEPPSIFRIFLLSFLGAILGILLMIPMRRFLIVEEHGKLPFPEGVACAQILKSGEKGARGAFFALIGIASGAIYKLLQGVFHLWGELVSWSIPKPFRTGISVDCTPALLGVGVIIGPRICSLLFAGGIVGWWVIIPLISKFGMGAGSIFPSTIPIDQMSPDQIWSNYVRYIGAGAIATGGLLSLFRIFPIITKTIKVGVRELFGKGAKIKSLPRTEQDISLRFLILGSVGIILFLWLFPGLPMNFVTILLLTFLGFLFVAVTSITVGLVGSTSNPVSGMTITTLFLTCLIFVALGWTDRLYLISALTMAIVVNVSIALAGTTSQDLKAGFLLGATPKWQQLAEIIGCILPAFCVGITLYLLNQAYGFGSTSLPAPQGTLMALIAEGVIEGNIPFGLVLIGVALALVIEILALPILPFAIGLYLPLSLSTSVMIGGLFALLIRKTGGEKEKERSILTASGLIAGDACMGVFVALLVVLGVISPTASPFLGPLASLATFVFLGFGIWRLCRK